MAISHSQDRSRARPLFAPLHLLVLLLLGTFTGAALVTPASAQVPPPRTCSTPAPRPAPPECIGQPPTGVPDVLIVSSPQGAQPWLPGSFQWVDYRVVNVGSGPTRGAIDVTEFHPQGLIFSQPLEFGDSGWRCTRNSDRTANCSLADTLAPGGVAPTLRLKVMVELEAPPTVTIQPYVFTPDDADIANNLATAAIVRIAGPRLTIDKNHAGQFFTLGSDNFYDFVVINEGEAPTRGEIRVVDTLPPGVRLVRITQRGGQAVGGLWNCQERQPFPDFDTFSVTCVFPGRLGPGQFHGFRMQVRVVDGAPVQIENIATVAGGGVGPRRRRRTATSSRGVAPTWSW